MKWGQINTQEIDGYGDESHAIGWLNGWDIFNWITALLASRAHWHDG